MTDTASPYNGVAIVGAYNTAQARHLPDETSWTITLKAVTGALADAGLSIDDVDGFHVLAGLPGGMPSPAFAYGLGRHHFWAGESRMGIAAVLEAATALLFGECEVVVVASGQASLFTDRASVAPWTRPANEFVECWGQMTPAEFALSAREHMDKFGTTPEQLATVASVIRNNGNKNPEAVYYGAGPYTPEDILASRMVADPYHLLDCAMTAEGGAALVLTTQSRAKDLKRTPVAILGGGREYWGPPYTHPPTYGRVGLLGRGAGDLAFRQAAISRDDVDVFELYDNFSWEIIRYFEALRYCDVGEGGDLVASGAIAPDGKYPICTDGGVMAHSHTGVSQQIQKVVQCVRQLRGESSVNQVADAEIALTAILGDVLILGTGN